MCCNAVGTYLLPLVIYKGKRVQAWMTRNLPTGFTVQVSPNGWISSEIFMKFLVEFNNFLEKNNFKKPTLLILDQHRTHNDINNLKFATENNILLPRLPAHCSHLVQPLDKSVFCSLKAQWSHACKNLMYNNDLGIPMDNGKEK